MKEIYIRLMAPVVPITATALINAIDSAISNKCERINLLISSPGGSVHYGLNIYNFLKGAPIEVYTYNFGSVDSIGVVVFCAGDKRYSVPHARFLIHGVKCTFQNRAMLDEKEIEEILKGLKIDYQNIAKVIADTIGQTPIKIEDDMNNRTTLNPEEAKEYGLIHEIKSELFPIGAKFINIDESIIQSQQGPVTMMQQNNTATENQGYTQSNSLHHGTYFPNDEVIIFPKQIPMDEENLLYCDLKDAKDQFENGDIEDYEDVFGHKQPGA